jgi:hypothetical protein
MSCTALRSVDAREFCNGGFPTTCSSGSNSSRHQDNCRRGPASSLASATIFSQPPQSFHCRLPELLRIHLLCHSQLPFSAQSVLSQVSHFRGSLQYLPVAIAVAVQHGRDMRVCPDPTHLFVDVLAKVGYVEDATPIVKARIVTTSRI